MRQASLEVENILGWWAGASKAGAVLNPDAGLGGGEGGTKERLTGSVRSWWRTLAGGGDLSHHQGVQHHRGWQMKDGEGWPSVAIKSIPRW